jgi:hypothetical protein
MRQVLGWRVSFCLLATLVFCQAAAFSADRKEEHERFGKELWSYVQNSKPTYQDWAVAEDDLGLPGPARSENCTTYLHRRAAASLADLPQKSLVVDEHCDADGNVLAVTVRLKAKEGYDARNGDWYWAHYLPDGTLLKTSADKNPHAKCGFVTCVDDGRLWVFPEVSADLAEFYKVGEPAKHVIRPGVGPRGMTLKSPDTETLLAYVVAKPGFFTKIDDGRLWVCKEGTEEAETIASGGELGKRVIRPAGGPLGMTINGPDNETIDEYLTAKKGFATRLEEGRLWVFRAGSDELDEYDAGNESAKIAVRPGAGPGGMTIKSVEPETIVAYLAACDGFETFIDDGRIWVFPAGDPAIKEFQEVGEPGKYVIRPGAGPLGMTVKALDKETMDAYLRVASR